MTHHKSKSPWRTKQYIEDRVIPKRSPEVLRAAILDALEKSGPMPKTQLQRLLHEAEEVLTHVMLEMRKKGDIKLVGRGHGHRLWAVKDYVVEKTDYPTKITSPEPKESRGSWWTTAATSNFTETAQKALK